MPRLGEDDGTGKGRWRWCDGGCFVWVVRGQARLCPHCELRKQAGLPSIAEAIAARRP